MARVLERFSNFLCCLMLQDRKLNITSYLAQTFQVFENFKLMAEVRQELDKLKNPMTLLPATQMTNQLVN